MARVLVTGATGFTGRFVVRRLAEARHDITAFVRAGSDRELIARYVGGFAIGNLDDPKSLQRALDGHEILVNVASLGFGHAPGVVDAADGANIDRAIYFSTTSVFTTLPAASRSVRTDAERVIQASRTPWTIFRPTMIYGNPDDRNLIRLIRWVDRWRIVPVFGPGTFLLQPVHADDLAQAVAGALSHRQSIRKAYNLSGGTVLNYNDMVQLVGTLLSRRPRLVHLPISASLITVGLIRKLPIGLKFSREQVLRLNEHKAFPHDEAGRDFGFAPRALRDGLAGEVGLYRTGRG